MSEATFDVLETLDELKSAGFSDAQTRALTQTLQAVVSTRQGDTATKSDIAEVKSEIAGLKAEIASVKADIAGLEVRLLKAINDQQRWTIGIMVVLVGVLFAAIRLV